MSRSSACSNSTLLHPALDARQVAPAVDQGDVDPADREAVVAIGLDHDVHVALAHLAGLACPPRGDPDVGAEEPLELGRRGGEAP